MRTPVIVTFANQKGGVGKTTLCIAFANYLYSKGVRVMVVDCDFQHSIVKRRQSDVKDYGEAFIPYEVVSAKSMRDEETAAMIERLGNDPSIEAVLIDSPGTLLAPGLPLLILNSNVLITPFHYDSLTSPSTLAFLLVVERLRERSQGRMTTKVFAVPNHIDARVGRAKDKEAWKVSAEKISKYAEITETILWRAKMGRISTVAELDGLLPVVSPVFDTIYSNMFGSAEPLREVRLQNIQLTEYCEEMEKQKKAEIARLERINRRKLNKKPQEENINP